MSSQRNLASDETFHEHACIRSINSTAQESLQFQDVMSTRVSDPVETVETNSRPLLSISSRRSLSSDESFDGRASIRSTQSTAQAYLQFPDMLPTKASDPVETFETSEKHQQSSNRSQPSLRQIAFRWWLWELLACVTSLLAMLAIVVFLWCYDRSPLPQ